MMEVTKPDGSVVVYESEDKPLSSSEIEQAHKYTMDCIDCHNRIGHRFPNPEEVIDQALANGEINRSLPYVKARAVELLQQEFSTQEEARQIVEQVWSKYQQEFPDVAAKHPEIFNQAKDYLNDRQTFAYNLLVNSRFRNPDVTWRSFADYSGHKSSPGCFRCHDGRHYNKQHETVRVRCTLCHSVPIIIHEGEIPEHFIPTLIEWRPKSHNRDSFIRRHQRGGAACEACHGENIEYGTDDSNFCANSGCHDRQWPGLVFD